MVSSFVGREAELARITRLSRDALRERLPRAAVIHGEPGGGKSRLLAEAAARVPITTRLTMTGYEPERHVPLAASRDLLRRLSAVTEHALLVDEVLLTGAAADHARIFEVAHRALTSMGAVLLVADDLHWADEASMALCHYLVRSAVESCQPLVLLTASRPSRSSRSLTESLGALLGEGIAAIDLGPLERSDGQRLAMHASPDLDAAQAENVWRKARGSPFWIEVLARSGGGEADVDQIVARRLESATADAAATISLLALAGRPLATDEVAQVLDWPSVRAVESVGELERSGLVSQSAGTVRVVHDLMRAAIERQVPRRRRSQLHGAFASHIERGAGDDVQQLVEALEHRAAAGLPTLDLALRVGRSHKRRLLGRDGLHRLLTVADAAEPSDQRVALHSALATLAAELGEHALALDRWGILADGLYDPTARARAAIAAGESAFELRLAAEAASFLSRARSMRADDPTVAVEADAVESSVLRWLEHRTEEADALIERALSASRAMAKDAGGPGAMAAPARRAYLRALRTECESAMHHGEPARTLEVSDEMADAARGFDEVVRLRALTLGGYALRMLGRTREAASRLRSVWLDARGLVLPNILLEAGHYLSLVLCAGGRLGEAEAVGDECLDLGRRMGADAPSLDGVRRVAHEVQLSHGDWREAAAALRDEAERQTDPHHRLAVHQTLAAGIARIAPEDSESEVRVSLTAARSDAETSECARCLAELNLRGADALARVGLIDDAAAWVERWKGCHPPPTPVDDFWRARAESSIASARGVSGAPDAVDDVHELAERLGLALDALWARMDLAKLRPDRAGPILREAARNAERMGAITELRLTERRLRELGVRTWRRGRAAQPFERLTEREREIAQLVARGATNPEIAGTLFLSRKTVERHISNILAKLGLRNRTELAASIKAPPDDQR